MKRTLRPAILAIPAALLGFAAPASSMSAVPTFEAVYEVEYKGRRAGESVQVLSYDAEADLYRFESTTTARGLARLIRPRPIVERSAFTLHDDVPRPVAFEFEDGSRSGDDNYAIAFDWQAGVARITTPEAARELPLTSGVFDRGTLQVALMVEFDGTQAPPQHRLIDEAEVETYRYAVAGREAIATPAGQYETLRVTQQREGSSRETVIWLAPALEFLPVKIEQRRDGEALTTLTLESVSGL